MMSFDSENLKYCHQCLDVTSGVNGSFLHYGDRVAVSPIFADFVDFVDFLRTNGLRFGRLGTFDIEKL